MGQLEKEFERGKITAIVEHFQLRTNSSQGIHYEFNRDNLLVSRMKVEGEHWEARINDIEWDVYRFRNANTSDYLTACVGEDMDDDLGNRFIHILKGEVYPDASFADP
ncbi:hypothetical protein AAVH_22956 [Aphelenchoides avenae]|nr:hypothetical protein AAVH_22956 [Aphelenchus avenae]